jgi:hypothetical protein
MKKNGNAYLAWKKIQNNQTKNKQKVLLNLYIYIKIRKQF